MRSRGVFLRLTSIEEVQASLRTFGGRIAALLDAQLGSLDAGLPEDGGAPFVYQQVFDQLGARLEAVRLVLVEAEDEHVRQQARISSLQSDSERYFAELYSQQVGVRQILAGTFGADRGFELAAISGNTPRGRKDLEEQVDQTVKLLRVPAVEIPEPRIRRGAHLDFVELADGLEDAKSDLRDARAELLRARKAGVQTMLVKRAAMADADRVFPAAAGTLEGFFRLVGEAELADRIRTSIRRVTRRQGSEDEEDVAAEEASTDVEPTEASVPEPASVPDVPPVAEPAVAPI
jgi:hypothetical protein